MNSPALFARRSVVAGMLAAGSLLALPGCETMPALSLEEAVRRLLLRSSDRAFARLTARGGAWDEAVALIGLPRLLGIRGELVAGLLTAPPVKDRLDNALALIAEDASARAAPVVADAVRTIGIVNARAILAGGPRAATDYLRSAMGSRLLDVLVPEFSAAIRTLDDPLVRAGFAALTGLDVAAASRSFAGEAEELIWRAIGEEEEAIRANPASSGDPVLDSASGAITKP
jgi:hypothetical protein